MTENITRRRVLRTVFGVSIAWFAGCGGPAARTIEIKQIESPVERDDALVIPMEIEASARNMDPSAQTFHNVTVVGYTTNQQVICQQEIGTVGVLNTPDINLSCSERPDYLTFTIRELNCNTSVPVYRINEPAGEEDYSYFTEKSCGAPELPVDEID